MDSQVIFVFFHAMNLHNELFVNIHLDLSILQFDKASDSFFKSSSQWYCKMSYNCKAENQIILCWWWFQILRLSRSVRPGKEERIQWTALWTKWTWGSSLTPAKLLNWNEGFLCATMSVKRVSFITDFYCLSNFTFLTIKGKHISHLSPLFSLQ